MQNLSPSFPKNASQEFFQGKMETFLTCRRLAEFLRENLLDESVGRNFEELALKSVLRTMTTNVSIADLQLLIAELPNILPLKYSVVDDILQGVLQMIPQFKSVIQSSIDKSEKMMLWRDFCELDYIFELVKTFEICRKK